ncbi:hypothetical protein ACHAXA_001982 [Cyclostephanos tholiformis]|uniref:Uncharacterized protein n=1 Tax=Cyclostephanos tholiformis TaxID=382380 RepID=A0ABD3SDW4_9STRA
MTRLIWLISLIVASSRVRVESILHPADPSSMMSSSTSDSSSFSSSTNLIRTTTKTTTKTTSVEVVGGDWTSSPPMHDTPPSSQTTTTTTTTTTTSDVLAVVVGDSSGGEEDGDEEEDGNDHHATTGPAAAAISPVTRSPTTHTLVPGPTPVPTVPPTWSPSRKYVPPPGDDDDDEASRMEREIPKIGKVLMWVFATFGIIWLLCYFGDAITFFVRNAYSNARRRGCGGCIRSVFPRLAVWRSSSGRGGRETLDQIIFESEDNAAPLLP